MVLFKEREKTNNRTIPVIECRTWNIELRIFPRIPHNNLKYEKVFTIAGDVGILPPIKF
jgi:hypothetical protein